jgi:hypothetical protein
MTTTSSTIALSVGCGYGRHHKINQGRVMSNEDDDSVCFYCGYADCRCNDEIDDDAPCSWCGGEGFQENDDPLWYGFDVDCIPCQCCDGTGLRSHQTIW